MWCARIVSRHFCGDCVAKNQPEIVTSGVFRSPKFSLRFQNNFLTTNNNYCHTRATPTSAIHFIWSAHPPLPHTHTHPTLSTPSTHTHTPLPTVTTSHTHTHAAIRAMWSGQLFRHPHHVSSCSGWAESIDCSVRDKILWHTRQDLGTMTITASAAFLSYSSTHISHAATWGG